MKFNQSQLQGFGDIDKLILKFVFKNKGSRIVKTLPLRKRLALPDSTQYKATQCGIGIDIGK